MSGATQAVIVLLGAALLAVAVLLFGGCRNSAADLDCQGGLRVGWNNGPEVGADLGRYRFGDAAVPAPPPPPAGDVPPTGEGTPDPASLAGRVGRIDAALSAIERALGVAP
jgi:hypothetical protein